MGDGPNWDHRALLVADNIHVLGDMNSESVDCIATDPPFNARRLFNAPLGSRAARQRLDDRWRRDEVTDQWHDLLGTIRPSRKQSIVLPAGSTPWHRLLHAAQETAPDRLEQVHSGMLAPHPASFPCSLTCPLLNLRNSAIIARVDHRRTAPGNVLFRQSGAFHDNKGLADRAPDSNDLERERGILATRVRRQHSAKAWSGSATSAVRMSAAASWRGATATGSSGCTCWRARLCAPGIVRASMSTRLTWRSPAEATPERRSSVEG